MSRAHEPHRLVPAGAQVFGEVSTRTGLRRLAPLPRRQAEPATQWWRMETWPDAGLFEREPGGL